MEQMDFLDKDNLFKNMDILNKWVFKNEAKYYFGTIKS